LAEIEKEKAEFAMLSLDLANRRVSEERRAEIKERHTKLSSLLKEKMERIRSIRAEPPISDACIFVKNRVFAGTEITIVTDTYHVEEEEKGPLSFRLKDGRVNIFR
jgi:hypothetical protein